MAAITKSARVHSTQPLFDHSRLITLTLDDDHPLGFVGGQYVIVDTGEKQSNGQPAKRAYSILSADCEQHTITLAALRTGDCPGLSYLHNVRTGDVVSFTGPWGNLRPRGAAPAPTLVCASDTGIAAALGLVRGEGFRALRPHTTFVWVKPEDDYLMPESMVRDFLPPGMPHVRVLTAANQSDAERAQAVMETTSATPSYVNAYVVGDEAMNAQLRTVLNAAGTDSAHIVDEP